ncbi:bS18 family ribosomal protein [Candidatus Fokinia crypta]|uniref:30S ribosomal protein S18 n=1 Tax=Candidatus Fokinia crypta TaxID=1920990 RepID=A0ABZ0UP26_9RICK|nr:bS18 family ribosomal protein [Candidatus Fokinia cryptica]WPX97647.1 30S ribosomal protein S18 [Candidatus Fokinia cryptica]
MSNTDSRSTTNTSSSQQTPSSDVESPKKSETPHVSVLPLLQSSILFNKTAEAQKTQQGRAKQVKVLNVVPFDVQTFKDYLSGCGRILPRKTTGLSRKMQAELKRCVKVARQLGLQ